MRIGYPCINRKLTCQANKTLRLASYSEKKLIDIVSNNLDCLEQILKYNLEYQILFFRISSDTIPFASHPICKFKWWEYFSNKFRSIGEFIKNNNIRISMHPDQFVLINSPEKNILEKSIRELEYHCRLLDMMDLDAEAKVQIHVGGVYNDKQKSIERFLGRYYSLGQAIQKRLVIENDERSYNLKDCIKIHKVCGIPIILDTLHHEIKNHGESLEEALEMQAHTWKENDGIPMVDYSTQQPDARVGTHAHSIEVENFKNFLLRSKAFNFDVMLEIKDKEKSAIKAVILATNMQQ